MEQEPSLYIDGKPFYISYVGVELAGENGERREVQGIVNDPDAVQKRMDKLLKPFNIARKRIEIIP